MAHSLGLEIVAEGVETEEQLALLAKLNCNFAQGYYFSRAIPAKQLLAFSAHHNQ
jgi:EAL domain-containing protein (putative c-di-GMP-specific phosphodiesterase class I)